MTVLISLFLSFCISFITNKNTAPSLLRPSDPLFLDSSNFNGSYCTYLSVKGPFIKWNIIAELWFRGEKWGNSADPIETVDFFQEKLYNLGLQLQSKFLGAKLKASTEPLAVTLELQGAKQESIVEMGSGCDLFDEMKNRFLSFKKHKYMENLEHFEALSRGQAPKFMVIACADSRVCPSNILGFQPGEAFMVRNVANMVPTYESGPSETNAALEFAVNTLEVKNILIIGHSCCGGIRALMSMPDEVNSSSFIRSWVIVGKNAKLSTKTAASNLSFDQQCTHCEKESINNSLLNLLTYPWIEEKVKKGVLSLHGGYYDFVDCTFEKWTLDNKESIMDGKKRGVVKNRSFWC